MHLTHQSDSKSITTKDRRDKATNEGVSLPSRTIVHAKLEMTSPQDAEELEADAVANEIVSGGKIRRKISQGGSGSSGIAVSSQMESQLSRLQGGGQQMPTGLQSMMENGFGRDLSQVRLHTDSDAATMSSSIHAKAFTLGNDIYFNHGQYSPETTEGQKLVAHEVTHVVQESDKLRRMPEEEKTPYSEVSIEFTDRKVEFKKQSKNGKCVLSIIVKKINNNQIINELLPGQEVWMSYTHGDNTTVEKLLTHETSFPMEIIDSEKDIEHISLKPLRQKDIELINKIEIEQSNKYIFKEPPKVDSVRMPIENGKSFKVTQGFYGQSSHNKGELNTQAIDIVPQNANEDINIVSVGKGKVVKVIKDVNDNNHNSEGNCVYILHTDEKTSLYGYISVYLHLKKAAQDDELSKLKIGSEINTGEIIGKMGNTGHSSGTHLHFAIVKYIVFLNTQFNSENWSFEGIDSMDDSTIKDKSGSVDENGKTKWN